MVSHPLRMREALGSIPSVSIGQWLETRKTLNNLEIERTVEKAHAVAAAVTLTVAVAVRRAAGRHTPPRVAKARPA